MLWEEALRVGCGLAGARTRGRMPTKTSSRLALARVRWRDAMPRAHAWMRVAAAPSVTACSRQACEWRECGMCIACNICGVEHAWLTWRPSPGDHLRMLTRPWTSWDFMDG